MESKEILGYVVAGILAGGFGTVMLIDLAELGLGLVNCLTSKGDKPLSSKEELESVVREEADKLNLHVPNVICFNSDAFEPGSRGTYAKKYPNGDTEISIEKGRGRKAVMHELYHLKKGDCEPRVFRHLYYLFVAEPRAIFYANYGYRREK